MSEFPEPWATYQHVQNKLMQRDRVDDVAWGLEAGLNRSLTHASAPEDIHRAAHNASRKERYQTQLRSIHFAAEAIVGSAENALIALQQLDRIRESVAAFDWNLLCDVADGVSYRGIADRQKTTPGALRVRVLRLRRAFRAA